MFSEAPQELGIPSQETSGGSRSEEQVEKGRLHQEVTQRHSRVPCIQAVPSRTQQEQPEGVASPGFFPSHRRHSTL